MSELLDKQVIVQKEENLRGSHKLSQAHEKVCDEMKQTKTKKRHAHKNVIEGRKLFITPIQNTSENDLHKLWGKDYGYDDGYDEGTIWLVNE